MIRYYLQLSNALFYHKEKDFDKYQEWLGKAMETKKNLSREDIELVETRIINKYKGL